MRIAALVLALTGCAAPQLRPPPIAPAELLAGGAVFDEARNVEVIPADDVVALDDEMRAFVAEHTTGIDGPARRMRQLLLAMRERGLFALDYTSSTTKTALETFHEKRGNCLSFTMLFVALAREAGLDARYQLVDIPPTWEGGSELVILNNHINAIIKTAFQPDYVVDFNIVDFKGNYDFREVSDTYAVALFYSNRGVEALSAGRDELSFRYFESAISAFPDISGHWVNLGVLYSRQGLHDYAEAAYLEALRRDSHNRSALSNLVTLYRSIGNITLANEYSERVRRYQERNPYYHYSLAEQAYRNDQPQETLAILKRAIRLKEDEHRFHFLQGLAHFELGNSNAARTSLMKARELAGADELKTRYAAKIAALSAASETAKATERRLPKRGQNPFSEDG